MPGLFDQLIGANEQRQWQFDPNGLGGLRIDKELDLGGLFYGQIGRAKAF
jgi:hypothetical protein